jgi:hypothetical protein
MRETTITLNYPTQEINLDFRIKVYGTDACGNRLNTLVGVRGLVNLIGEELANKFLERAYRLVSNKCVCKLRRGLQVTFYNK